MLNKFRQLGQGMAECIIIIALIAIAAIAVYGFFGDAIQAGALTQGGQDFNMTTMTSSASAASE